MTLQGGFTRVEGDGRWRPAGVAGWGAREQGGETATAIPTLSDALWFAVYCANQAYREAYARYNAL